MSSCLLINDMINKILKNLRAILAIYFSRQLLVCFSEFRRVSAAPCLADTMDARTWTTELPAGHEPHNGSITYCSNTWFLAVRTANYGYSKVFKRLEVPGGPSHVDSATWLLELDDDFRISERTILSDAAYRDISGPARNGFTDPRLFEWKDQLWGLWSAERVLSDDWSNIRNTMALGLIEDTEMKQIKFLASPHGRAREKNWMPWIIAEELRFVYALANMEVYRLREGTLELLHAAAAPDPQLCGYSGSSQLQPWGSDWICVAHYAARAIRAASAQFIPSFYLHRFVVVSSDFTIKALSPEFFLEHKGTEFCAGLVIRDDSVILSYGVRDCESRIMRMPIGKVNELLKPPQTIV